MTALRSAGAALVRWFEQEGRSLPWRESYDPYHVWLSEIMLQQTQMSRGVEYFNRWVERFPDVQTVAAATEAEILKAWEGLGYYSRARNLHRAAGIVVERHGGRFPRSRKELLALPGVGPYTAAAIRSIAWREPDVVCDANAVRVTARLLDDAAPAGGRTLQSRVVETLEEMGSGLDPRAFSQAVMELGALICRPREPRCAACPIVSRCWARAAGTERLRPAGKAKPAILRIEAVLGVLVDPGGLWIRRCPPGGLFAGLWEFPWFERTAEETLQETLRRGFRERHGLQVEPEQGLGTVRHSFTNHRVRLEVWRLGRRGGRAEGVRPVPAEGLAAYAFQGGSRKVVEMLRRQGLLEQ
ncbi:MAG: A/G-specific adenine glycosylase [Synergistales bacterium]|nr:A/G-specific adenine glycosylase [Synergistales bacterium]